MNNMTLRDLLERIKLLEDRVHELEERVDELEQEKDLSESVALYKIEE